jgi:hypothetical protein
LQLPRPFIFENRLTQTMTFKKRQPGSYPRLS